MPRPFAILLVGVVGSVLFLTAGVMGFMMRVEAPQVHLLVGLAAALAWLFSQAWIAAYCLLARRWVGLARETLLWALVSTALVLATFATGAPALTRALQPRAHLTLALAAAVAQALALWRESSLLARQRQRLVDLDASGRA
jgi:hypothetical protein